VRSDCESTGTRLVELRVRLIIIDPSSVEPTSSFG